MHTCIFTYIYMCIFMNIYRHNTAKYCDTQKYSVYRYNTTYADTILQHTATHWSILHIKVQHTATHCNTPQHAATHCNTLQYTAIHYICTHCTTLCTQVNFLYFNIEESFVLHDNKTIYCSTLQHTATHCNTPQYTATHCVTLQQATYAGEFPLLQHRRIIRAPQQ